jgi:hypothetical protein
LTSSLEAEKLKTRTRSESIYSNSPAVHLHNDNWATPVSSDTCELFFLGNIYTAQNREAVEFIANEILPRIVAMGVDARLNVSGEAPRNINAKLGGNVIFHGYTPNLLKLASQCHLALLPVLSGTGIKTKILDAFSLGMPVITNCKGVEGIPVTPGVHAEVADTAQELASAVYRLFKDPVKAALLGRQGKAYVEVNNSYELLKMRYALNIGLLRHA